ncbi:E3 ubiquitin-protein ligase complex SLX5-SLX8 subunit SLX8 [Drosophila subpulchrella]|uniref:E3 ubiquitin-protein ligase complex SLX5-SLX8 subunit SLX8 n=1 Tax=Drosophila subpulchrella TaxID=1486046 RepID=UPI0018A1702E|nr:E3 ubiquitin-protein ligase complex SLX5-SLX8 subunit SLX8 [Drosophila subpulchrella]XP_037710845.1 E3 ubiquitin-protein ligase complex SLX5-SLX8 subunit SLX8 [Drosophila subpulchrella]
MKRPPREADETERNAIVDLTFLDEIQPVPRRLTDQNNRLMTCPICIEPPETPVATLCGHIFCMGCLIPAMRRQRICPICKESVSEIIQLHL